MIGRTISTMFRRDCFTRKYSCNRLGLVAGKKCFANNNVTTPVEYWNKVIFTDGSKLNIFGSDGHCTVWRKKKNTELKPRNLKPTVKHGGGSVLVWGCTSAAGVGSLEFIDGIMDHRVYIDILKRDLDPSAQKMNIKDDSVFMHDNVRSSN